MQFQVAPASSEWRNYTFPAGPKLFRMDLKTRRSEPDAKTPYKKVPQTCKTEQRNILQALLGDPAITGDQQFGMSAEDMLVYHDGRNLRNGMQFMKDVAKPLALRKVMWPARKVAQVRLLYHNDEFETGFARPARRVESSVISTSSASSPEPLETIYILKPKDVTVPLRARVHLDLPGRNRDRGWAKNGLKNAEERLLTALPTHILEKMFTGQARGDGLEDEVLDLEPEQEAEETDGEEGNDSTKHSLLFPWEAEEKQVLEIYNCYSVSQQVTIVDIYGGAMAAIAACREKRNYLGFVPNTFSQTVLHEMVLLRVLIDMVLGSIVTKRRHLTRAHSLGGEPDVHFAAHQQPSEPNGPPSPGSGAPPPADQGESDDSSVASDS